MRTCAFVVLAPATHNLRAVLLRVSNRVHALSCAATIYVLRRCVLPIQCTLCLFGVLRAHAGVATFIIAATFIMVTTFTQHSSLHQCCNTHICRSIVAAFIMFATCVIDSTLINTHHCRSLCHAACVNHNVPCAMFHACTCPLAALASAHLKCLNKAALVFANPDLN